MSNTEMSNTASNTAANRMGLNWWQAIAAGAVVAAVGNLVIFFIGRAAGASFVFSDQGAPQEVTVWAVVVATVLPLVVGTALAVLIARWWSGVIRLAQVIGGGLALLTVADPVMTDADGATLLALVLMHVVVAVAVVVILEVIRRQTKARRQV